MGIDTRKHVFGVFDKTSLKPVSSATATSKKSEISFVISEETVLANK